MMKQSFWCPLNPPERAGSLAWSASTCYCRAFFPFILIFFEVNLSSFMWFLASPGEAQADSSLVLLGPPFSLLMPSDVEENFDHRTESTCRAPLPQIIGMILAAPPRPCRLRVMKPACSLGTRVRVTELDCLPVVCTCAAVSVSVGPLQT